MFFFLFDKVTNIYNHISSGVKDIDRDDYYRNYRWEGGIFKYLFYFLTVLS